MAQPMSSDSELKISAEGIFVSGSQGPSRLWEFHPDDVVSVGVYCEDGQMHEVIATLNRDFDVPEATSGLTELNERLSRELNATLTIDAEYGSSPSGMVLWPSHLAGNPLEMARLAKHHFGVCAGGFSLVGGTIPLSRK
jgi:hypothetical protein